MRRPDRSDLTPLNVYLTVDVECSMGGAWGNASRRPVPPERRMLCRNSKGEWGTGFLAAELKRYGLRATFFTEMFAAEIFGEEALRPVVGGLLDAGQDVQLHLHPIFLRYAECMKHGGSFPVAQIGSWPDALSSYSEDEQTNIITRGMDIFHRVAGLEPVAFRAGGYLANSATLRSLKRAGISLDSSFNPAYSCSFPDSQAIINQVRFMDGVWEVPVTVARTHFPDRGTLKHLEIPALSFKELRKVLESASRNGLQHVVIMFHSFSTVKARDIIYERFRPDRIVIRRFRRLLRFLAANQTAFQVRTFTDLSQEKDGIVVAAGPISLPDLGLTRPMFRKALQAVNRLYWV